MDSAGTIENHADAIKFPNFDVVPLAADHNFLRSNKSTDATKKINNVISSVIMKEWKILRENLPDSIYVQVYETRIDLMRAVIVGSPGTPYHDGLFFFDISLPSDYPNHPPKVYYRSHGHRLNPNLYASGLVCLSLLNTWTGSKTEIWSKKSTILQTLVSIQGLVLNERPFYNEPGYNSDLPNLVNKSIHYNQHAFVLSCKTMIHIVGRPPGNFEDFVRRHFRARAGAILSAVKEYEEGAVVGRPWPSWSSVEAKVKVSRTIVAELAKVRSELLIAFSPFISEAAMDDHARNVVVKPKENVNYVVKPKENVKKNKKWTLSKLIGLDKCIGR